MSAEYKLKILKDRSFMMKSIRSFFYKKKILEVDPPSLVKHPSIDEHIGSISAHATNNQTGYLHTSPEYAMKRLISGGLKNIYFLGHAFRKNEIGQNHNPEFTMIEWYRSDVGFEKFIKENISLIKLFIRIKKVVKITYFDLFYKNFNLNVFKCQKDDLLKTLKKIRLAVRLAVSDETHLKKDDLLNLLMDFFFEKKSVNDFLYIVYDFPPSMAALAKIKKKNKNRVAQRFEFFLNGLEIANGYFELNDEKILRQRFEKIIKTKKSLTLDEKFLLCVNNLGSCFGIAIGFDRLMMLRHKTKNISSVLPFSFSEI